MQIKIWDLILHPPEWLSSKTQVADQSEEDVEQGEYPYIAGGSANFYRHFGKQWGSFSEKWELIYLRTQL